MIELLVDIVFAQCMSEITIASIKITILYDGYVPPLT